MQAKIQLLYMECETLMLEEGHLHKCEMCNDYYRHNDYKCNKYTKWGKCEKHNHTISL
jgi:hypothetical protein